MNNYSDPTKRFSDKVENYIKYRPSYPKQVLKLLKKELNLLPSHVVADLGSGTGIFSKLLLANGNPVYGIEPNEAMRQAAQNLLQSFPHFISTDGTAESTTLEDQSIDLVAAAQAAHWFNIKKVRQECLRILRPKGGAILIWNERKFDGSDFLKAYEDLLKKYGTDYEKVRHTYVTAQDDFFGSSTYKKTVLENSQVFDFEGLSGRLLSSSYIASDPNDVHYKPMMQELKEIFDSHQKGGQVKFEYRTIVYYGVLV